MTPQDVEPAGVELFGEGWRVAMPAAFDVDPSTVRRWHGSKGDGSPERTTLPGPVSAALQAWLELRRRHGTVPPPEPRLPFGGAGAPNDGWDGTPTCVDRAGPLLFGRKWKLPLTAALGINPATLWRNLQEGEVPGPITAALRAWLAIHALDGRLPPPKPGLGFREPTEASGTEKAPRKASRSRYAGLLPD